MKMLFTRENILHSDLNLFKFKTSSNLSNMFPTLNNTDLNKYKFREKIKNKMKTILLKKKKAKLMILKINKKRRLDSLKLGMNPTMKNYYMRTPIESELFLNMLRKT